MPYIESAFPMPTRSRAIDRLRRSYVAAAVLLFNILLLFVLANLAMAGAIQIWHRWKHSELGPEVRRYGFERISRAYPGWPHDKLIAFFKELNLSNEWQYEPYTTFRPIPFRGRFINVSVNGYRQGFQPAAWPPSAQNYNVFWFGGSTAFGVGVPDDQTIASWLQAALEPRMCGRTVAVYNFARPQYFSVQEGILFQRLLRDQLRPDLAVFLDGLNEFCCREPTMTPLVSRMVDEARSGRLTDRVVDLAAALPIAKLRFLRAPRPPYPNDGDGMNARQIVDRWLQNCRFIEAIAREEGIRVLFVWQPVPNYHYDLRFHLFGGPADFAGLTNMSKGYSLVDDMRSKGALAPNVLWLGDLQASKRENLYVDQVHYSPKFSREIAAEIARFARQQDLCTGVRPSG